MRAITVQQPYAWAIATCADGAKDVENRARSVPWRSAVGQRIAIHAGKRRFEGGELDPRIIALGRRLQSAPAAAWHSGAVVAVATLADVHWGGACRFQGVQRQQPVVTKAANSAPGALCSAWAEPDAWHLVWENVVPLPRPVPARGFQGLWTLPVDVEWAVAQQVGAA
jgi:hypothetical protein